MYFYFLNIVVFTGDFLTKAFGVSPSFSYTMDIDYSLRYILYIYWFYLVILFLVVVSPFYHVSEVVYKKLLYTFLGYFHVLK